ncbi:MAG: hypothetical protein U0636_06845 [Phycisphaerales bacterium]
MKRAAFGLLIAGMYVAVLAGCSSKPQPTRELSFEEQQTLERETQLLQEQQQAQRAAQRQPRP